MLEDCGPAFGNSTPQFHMRDRSCPSADPDGPFYCERHQKYHLFYQSPKGRPCQPPTQPCDQFTEVWGHATSTDLVRWKHLPAAIWPDERYDMSGAWTGSATVVGGIPHLMFPGLNVVEHLPETMNIATPANLSDEDYTHWKMSPLNPIVQAGHDFTTAWRTAAGEWRVTNVDGAVFCSSDFKSWTRAPTVGAPVFPGGECPDLYALPPPCAGCNATADAATAPTHVFKRSNQQFDGYQFGRYADGQRNSSGVWHNYSTGFLPVDFSYDEHNQSHVYLPRQTFLLSSPLPDPQTYFAEQVRIEDVQRHTNWEAPLLRLAAIVCVHDAAAGRDLRPRVRQAGVLAGPGAELAAHAAARERQRNAAGQRQLGGRGLAVAREAARD